MKSKWISEEFVSKISLGVNSMIERMIIVLMKNEGLKFRDISLLVDQQNTRYEIRKLDDGELLGILFFKMGNPENDRNVFRIETEMKFGLYKPGTGAIDPDPELMDLIDKVTPEDRNWFLKVTEIEMMDELFNGSRLKK